MVIQDLEQDLGHELATTRFEVDRADMLSIVKSCLGYAGALRGLVDQVEFVDAGTNEFQLLRRVVDEIEPIALLNGDQRAALYALLSAISCPSAESFYWLSVGPWGPPPTGDRGDVVSLARDLESVLSPNGVPPLLVFIELVAERTPSRTAALRTWVDAYAARAAIKVEQVAQIRTSAASPDANVPTHSYLIVQLEPFPPAPTREYLLSAWFQQGDRAKSLRRGEGPLDIEGVRQELDYLLTREAEVTRDRATTLTLEMILPRQLIGRDFDQWIITPEGFGRPLGAQFPVVVRVLERLRTPALHREWRRKWRWLKGHGHDPMSTLAAMHWIREPGLVEPRQLMIQFMTDETPVCLGMAFAPSPGGTLGDDEFAACVHAGTPAIVWCRDKRAADFFEHEIRELIGSHGLLRLPELVHQHRQHAHHPDATPGHLGRHLTLLWDDADRIPELFDELLAPVRGEP